MKRRNEVLVGVLITFALVVAIGGTLWLARKGVGRYYPLHTRFDWGAGLKQGQPVLLAGIQAGTIKKIRLNDAGYIDVELDIGRDYRVPEGSTATVAQVSLFGDKAVALNPPPRPLGTFIAPGDTVPAGRPTPTIDELLFRLDTVSRGVADMTATIQIEFVRNGGIADLRRTIARTNDFVQQLSTIADQQSRGLTRTMTNLNRTMSAIDSAALDSTVRNVNRTTANLAALTTDLQQTTTRLNALLGKLESGDGSAGKLLNDPGLYNDVRSLVARMDSLMTDLKKNPKRYINLEIF
jgi:phospholipid/cholesterol/gamma-HCH transport system substrate-binding protein